MLTFANRAFLLLTVPPAVSSRSQGSAESSGGVTIGSGRHCVMSELSGEPLAGRPASRVREKKCGRLIGRGHLTGEGNGQAIPAVLSR